MFLLYSESRSDEPLPFKLHTYTYRTPLLTKTYQSFDFEMLIELAEEDATQYNISRINILIYAFLSAYHAQYDTSFRITDTPLQYPLRAIVRELRLKHFTYQIVLPLSSPPPKSNPEDDVPIGFEE